MRSNRGTYVHTAATTATLTSVLHVPRTMTGCYSVICSSIQISQDMKKVLLHYVCRVWFDVNATGNTFHLVLS